MLRGGLVLIWELDMNLVPILMYIQNVLPLVWVPLTGYTVLIPQLGYPHFGYP